MKPRTYEEAQYWAKEHKKWASSGQDQEGYCKSVGLEFKAFKSGFKKASSAGLLPKKRELRLPESQEMGGSGFKRIELEPATAIGPKTAYCEIWFEGNLGIRLETKESLSQMRELMKGLMI